VSLVDSHCHLDHRQFASEIDEVLERAAKAGVDRMLTIGTGEGPEDLDCALKIASRYPHVFATAGVSAARIHAATTSIRTTIFLIIKS